MNLKNSLKKAFLNILTLFFEYEIYVQVNTYLPVYITLLNSLALSTVLIAFIIMLQYEFLIKE